ncbi:50S ribosomal protein L29 [Candidatus Aerophobetes bacterium]|uniref:Large ribosomal subunit protein uL29 n=1 Tax=Aerophobetes bacterium TaxID=2030807 RepID=A0A7V5M002_UNCAE|nr:50S ribosomal protein L29 [Candidatus Aerophobetes bacterium]HHF98507.1 50S ribosomal protein L29 [Candidatus Aerophobetes bacterium]
MRASELRDLGTGDLLEKLKQLQAELLDLRIQAEQGRMGNPSSIRKIKKDIARIKTILRERELGIKRGD